MALRTFLKKHMSKEMTRRDFLKTGSIAAVGIAAAPATAEGASDSLISRMFTKKKAPSDRLNILAVGVGGRGADDLLELESQNIIGLCDVDWDYARHTFDRYPDVRRFNDYRVMYDQMLKDADAVLVATADHTHAIIAADAITAGKHVYCEKPLTHTVYESRLLAKLAAKYKVATQMGNQGASAEGVRKACEWIWNGEIGEVTKVEAFTDRPIWPQGMARPKDIDPIPATLNWNSFIGPAPYRPYNKAYTPWNFRGWWDFGTGALGDMACHILHPAFKALNLKYPVLVQGTSTPVMPDSCPSAQIVKMVFPARDNMPKVAMPEVEVWWYDGGLRPQRPAGLWAGKDLKREGGGLIFHGTKDTLICGGYGFKPYLVSGRQPEAPHVLREINQTHQMDWVRACKEDPVNRVLCASDFSEAGPFNEMVVMGVLAVRLQHLNMELEWDGENMRFTNLPQEEEAFAAEMIRHKYREGWSLPDMP